jgi:pyrimidine deaminase RibD-like protein
MKSQDFKIHSTDKLDLLLVRCCELIFDYYQRDPEYWGKVAACVLDPDNNAVFGINHYTDEGTRKHGERVAIENYERKYGQIPEGSIIVTTLSPCSLAIADRYQESCTDLLADKGVHKV